MKFFEFVSWCGPTARPAVQTVDRPHAEEATSLVPSPPPSRSGRGRNSCRKRGRVAASKSGEWRPSLGAISEDNVVPEKDGRTAAGSDRILKRKVESAARVHVRRHSDDVGRASLPTIIPPFTPAPFLF